MPIVEITDWRIGFRKVSCTIALQASVGLGLSEAKRITDGVLARQIQRIELASAASAKELAATLQELGASAHVVPTP